MYFVILIMEDLSLYSTIEYTPGWYYTHFPGFYNIECYKILSDFSNHPEKYCDNGTEESKDNDSCEDEYEREHMKKKIRLDQHDQHNGV